jgi:hypothetical protein
MGGDKVNWGHPKPRQEVASCTSKEESWASPMVFHVFSEFR